MTPRDLPDLSAPVPLPPTAAADLRTHGHTVVRALASPDEVAAYRPALLAAGARGRYDHRPLAERDTYGRAFVQMFNLWTHDDEAKAFVFARRFAKLAADLMGVAAVRLYHDQALFKEPGGGPTPWHQDQFYWPLATEHTITMWMPLVEVTREMGPMEFASRSQRLGNLGDFAIGDESQREFQRIVEDRELRVGGYERFEPGDASFHSGWTLHRAPGNDSDRMREVMTVIYFDAAAEVGPLDHPARRFDRDTWLRGCEPGELAAGPLNPVLYAEPASES